MATLQEALKKAKLVTDEQFKKSEQEREKKSRYSIVHTNRKPSKKTRRN